MRPTKQQLAQFFNDVANYFAGGGQILEQEDFEQMVEDAGLFLEGYYPGDDE